MPFLLSHDIPQRMPSQVLELVQQGTFQGMDSCQGHAKEVVYSSSHGFDEVQLPQLVSVSASFATIDLTNPSGHGSQLSLG